MKKQFAQVQVESRAAWRSWLAANYTQTEGIWLVTFKKHVKDKYLPYDDIVEEALCFGWIDSLPRKLDEDRTMLFLSPRRPKSPWSGLNKRRIEKIMAEGLMMPPGQAMIDQAKEDGSWSLYDDIEALVIPPDLAAALEANSAARKYFDRFSDSSKKGILWWIKSAKRPATRQKRIAETVALAAQNIKANHPRP
ncbi:MAG: YdeI/OmpD-associated family protein [Ardenticatenaceae bacterium]|nr:YdeI/OmpD-associated family protein [Ardenticatenaceae bacterium]